MDLSEDRGTLITSISTNWLTLKWLNENELIASGFFGIQIINASNGAKRSIESRDAVFTFRVSNDSEKIFYILGGACSPSCSEDLYSIQANGQERTLIQDSIAFSPLSDNNISLSENGLFLAYKILDSLYIYNTINNTSEFQLDVAGFPISFSPDGNHLLYSTNSGYSILSIENRTSEEQEFDIGIGRIRKIRWDNEGIKAFFQGIPTNQYFVKNFSTNNQVKLWETNDTPYNSEFDWSEDGNKIAAWTGICLEYDGWNCEISRTYLNILDIPSTSARVVVKGINASARNLAISYDNKRIAHVMNSNIYIQEIQ